MHEPHPIFEPPVNLDSKIWRFMNIQKFQSLLEKESLHFSKVTSFEDPFEGTVPEFNKKNTKQVYSEIQDRFASKKQFDKFIKNKPKMDEITYEMLKNQLLVNCWHINDHESASMWKLYTSNMEGIAIQSTYRKIKESFNDNTDDTIWIGRVIYSDYSREWMNEWNAYQRFITKRISFECESELRLITALPEDNKLQKVLGTKDIEREKTNPSKPRIVNPNELTPDGKFVKLNIDSLIENIYIAPLSSNDFVDRVNFITKKNKPNLVNKIQKSDLYTLQ
ncbi:hypothetical protein YTPLAS73_09590 [Nitrosarchaeum sp.]|nr:hypothetical protein YTPLAS73_09590 [Nitrosarchaeum sp.]